MPQWQCPHAVPHAFRHTPHTLRGPIGNSTEDDAHSCVTHNCIWLGPSPDLLCCFDALATCVPNSLRPPRLL
eukprot:7044909-Pyramimonas_sp.AAC.1